MKIAEEDRELFYEFLNGSDIEKCISAIPDYIVDENDIQSKNMPRVQARSDKLQMRLDVFIAALKVFLISSFF